MLSGKGCGTAQTTRMLAQKQPYIKRVRNSSLVEWFCAENVTGLSIQPKLGLCTQVQGVGERCIQDEVRAEALVDGIQVRMPE